MVSQLSEHDQALRKEGLITDRPAMVMRGDAAGHVVEVHEWKKVRGRGPLTGRPDSGEGRGREGQAGRQQAVCLTVCLWCCCCLCGDLPCHSLCMIRRSVRRLP